MFLFYFIWLDSRRRQNIQDIGHIFFIMIDIPLNLRIKNIHVQETNAYETYNKHIHKWQERCKTLFHE